MLHTYAEENNVAF